VGGTNLMSFFSIRNCVLCIDILSFELALVIWWDQINLALFFPCDLKIKLRAATPP
jgi:hypothetical protein